MNRLFYSFVFLVLQLLVVQGQSVQYQPMYTDQNIDQASIDVNLAVGSSEGKSSVINGISTYEIPLVLPLGTGGITPKLSINYASGGGSSQFGRGWGLAGLSAISRSGQSFYHEGQVTAIDFTTNDRFVMDGNRMMTISGPYGATGSIYAFEAENYSRITSYGGVAGDPDYFIMETKDGVKYEYGTGINGKVLHTSGKTMEWYLSKMTYPDGNYIVYNYKQTHTLAGVISPLTEQAIDEILYTGNANAGISPFAQVKFYYGLRSDFNAGYINGQRFYKGLLTLAIEVKTQSQDVRLYNLFYGFNNGNSYLSEIKEKSNGETLNSTKIKYGIVSNNVQYEPLNIHMNDDYFPSNMNGDGVTDLLYARRNPFLIGYHDYFHGQSNQAVHVNLPQTSSVEGVIDCNGDQIDDVGVLVRYDRVEIIEDEIPYEIPYQLYDFKVYHNSNPAGNLHYGDEYTLPPIADTILRINYYINHITPGDFNGDGLGDYLFINGTAVYISYGQRSTTQPLSNWVSVQVNTGSFTPLSNWGGDIEKMFVIEYNGDGKSDILLINGAWSAVFSFTTTSVLDIVFFNNTGLFDQAHLLYQGDFNGDGLSDFLRRIGPHNSANWSILTNTGGNGFVVYSQSIIPKPSIDQPQFGVYYGDVISVGDFNGDGRSDIMLTGNNSPGTYNTLYLSSGGSMTNTVPYQINTGIAFQNAYTAGDYAGRDGKARNVLRYSGTQGQWTVGLNPGSKEHLVQKVKNGELHTTTFDYKLMNEKIDLADDFYVRGDISDASYNVSNVQIPAWLVKDFKVQNGSGAPGNYADIHMKVQTFKYGNAKLHRTGKGLIGFGKICNEDKWSNLRTLNYSSPEATYGIMIPDSVVTEFVTGADYTKSITQNQLITAGSGRYLLRGTKMIMYNYYENRRSTQDIYSYDAWSNPTDVYSRTYINSPSQVIESQSVVSTYGAYGSSTPDKPTSVTSTVFRSGTTNYTSNATISYNSLGQVVEKKEFQGQPKEVTTAYTYWPHGGVKMETKTSTGLPTKVSHITYDPLGRYVTERRNTDNVVIYTASYQDVVSGKPTTVTDATGQTSTYEYDVWGRLKKSTSATGIVSDITYNWETQYGVKSETHSAPGRAMQKIYLDNLGRKRRTATEGFNGDLIYQDYVYDYIGNLFQTTAPYKSSEPILSNYSTYQPGYTNQRISSTTTNVAAFGTTQFDYTYQNGNETISVTAPDGKITSSKIDPAGKTLQTTDSKGSLLDFEYYSHGGLRRVKQGTTTLLTIEYDQYNRKKKQTDMSAGVTQYDHDAYGRLVTETNAKGQTTTILYDKYDRTTTITRPEGTTTYEYWPAGIQGKAYKLKKVTGHAGDVHEHDYDSYGRITTQTITIDGQNYATTWTYDAQDRIQSKTYPTGHTLQYEYDSKSYLKRIYSGSTPYATIDEVNGRGQITKYTLGNGKQSVHEFFHGIPTKCYTTDQAFSYSMRWDYKSGNLLARWDQRGNRDTMEYDVLDRLVGWMTTSSGGSTRRDTITYADNGNILKKTDVGTYTYDPSKIYAAREVTNPSGVIRDPQQYISYNSFLQPDTIREGAYTLVYTYGYDGQRIKSVLTSNGTVKETKYYFGDYEKIITPQSNSMVQYVSLEGKMIAIIESSGSSHIPHYVYSDHLGSILMVTDGAGNVQAEQNFDPWGRRRDTQTWSYIDENLPLHLPVWLYRGYTGHEHMPQFRLINMNGRLYDPELARMLSPDNVLQSAGYTQNYNRYSYALNNPLRYIDPDGNEPISLTTIIIISTISSVVSNGISNVSNQKPFFQGALKAAVWGAVSGAVTFGIGEVAKTIGNVYFRFIFQAYAHGFYNGIATELQGGKFIHGFAAGAISSAAATFAGDVLKAGPVGQILAGGVSGGLAAEISGGDFIKGFTTGVIVSAFNHWAHEAVEGGGDSQSNSNKESGVGGAIYKNLKEIITSSSPILSDDELFALNTISGSQSTFFGFSSISLNNDRFLFRYFKFFSYMNAVGNVASSARSIDIMYSAPNRENILSQSYNLAGNILSMGVAYKIGATYGGPYGAAAGLGVDVGWYTAPITYNLAKTGVNNFIKATHQVSYGLQKGAIPYYWFRR